VIQMAAGEGPPRLERYASERNHAQSACHERDGKPSEGEAFTVSIVERHSGVPRVAQRSVSSLQMHTTSIGRRMMGSVRHRAETASAA
jgi:hypothetical protein